jgi:hypothetical protein
LPGTDDYGQDVPWLDNGDTPDLRVATKGLADALTPRSVMRFATAAERNATILAPVAGMVAFLATEKLFTGYDGSAWVVMAAGTSSWTTISLASGFTHDGNSNGNLQYRIVSLFGEPTVMFRGGIGVTYGSVIPNSGVITASALPTSARPTDLRTVTGACSTTNSDVLSVKIDVQPSGHIQIVGTTTSSANPKIQPPWISFNGLFCSL